MRRPIWIVVPRRGRRSLWPRVADRHRECCLEPLLVLRAISSVHIADGSSSDESARILSQLMSSLADSSLTIEGTVEEKGLARCAGEVHCLGWPATGMCPYAATDWGPSSRCRRIICCGGLVAPPSGIRRGTTSCGYGGPPPASSSSCPLSQGGGRKRWDGS